MAVASDYVGVCYGLDGNNLPPPQEVIDLCKSNNIKKMRINQPNHVVMQALGGSEIVLILGVPNKDIEGLANFPNAATKWVQDNVQQYINSVRFSYIAVGTDVKPSDQATRSVLVAMEKINGAIISLGLENRVKVSTAIDSTILGQFRVPSQAMFSSQARSYIEPIINFLLQTRAPLLANVHPYFAHVNHPSIYSLPFALFTPKQEHIINDGYLAYNNLFDFMLDGIYCAVEKLVSQRLEIVVSATGWPSSGASAATSHHGKTYYTNLIHHVMNGTPKRQQPIETYLFAKFDENLAANATDRNFGLFFHDKRPKYPTIFPLN